MKKPSNTSSTTFWERMLETKPRSTCTSPISKRIKEENERRKNDYERIKHLGPGLF